MTMTSERPGADPLHDPRRLASLHATNLLDTGPEESFDQLTRLAARLLRAPTSLLGLLTAEREYFKSTFGLQERLREIRETPLSHSFCQYVVAEGDTFSVDDSRTDPRVRGNRGIVERGIAAYLGAPLRLSDGTVLGALCAMDDAPHPWTSEDREVLAELARIAAREIERRIVERQPPARFARLINLLPVGLYICDGTGRLVFYNERAALLWGQSPALPSTEQAAFGTNALARVDGEPVEPGDLPAAIALRDRVTTSNREFLLSPGHTVLVSAGPSLGADDQILGAVVVLQDVTDVRKAARLRDDLLSLVSHELRTPLTVINGMAHALERRIPASEDTEARMAVSDIILAGQRMERVVENMLLLSRLEHESTEPEPVLVSLAVNAALERHHRDFPRSEVEVDIRDRSLTVQAVPSWLHLILVNLLNNAAQYGDGRQAHRLLALRVNGDTSISLCNSGELLQDDDYRSWFEPFYRGAATSAVIPGAGLGLTVAMRLADAQSGSLSAAPWANHHGTMVTLMLPQPVPGR